MKQFPFKGSGYVLVMYDCDFVGLTTEYTIPIPNPLLYFCSSDHISISYLSKTLYLRAKSDIFHILHAAAES